MYWEYFYCSLEIINNITDKQLNDYLTQYGKNRWELVNVVYADKRYNFFFKRHQ